MMREKDTQGYYARLNKRKFHKNQYIYEAEANFANTSVEKLKDEIFVNRDYVPLSNDSRTSQPCYKQARFLREPDTSSHKLRTRLLGEQQASQEENTVPTNIASASSFQTQKLSALEVNFQG